MFRSCLWNAFMSLSLPLSCSLFPYPHLLFLRYVAISCSHGGASQFDLNSLFLSVLFQWDGISWAHMERELRWGEVLSWAWLVLTESVDKQSFSEVPLPSASSSRHLLLTHNSSPSSLNLVLQVKCRPAVRLGPVPTVLLLLQLLGRRPWCKSMSTGLGQLSSITDLLCVLVQSFNFSKPIISSVHWDNNNRNADPMRLFWGFKGYERIP